MPSRLFSCSSWLCLNITSKYQNGYSRSDCDLDTGFPSSILVQKHRSMSSRNTYRRFPVTDVGSTSLNTEHIIALVTCPVKNIIYYQMINKYCFCHKEVFTLSLVFLMMNNNDPYNHC